MTKSESSIALGLMFFILLNTTPKAAIGIPVVDAIWRLAVTAVAMIYVIRGAFLSNSP